MADDATPGEARMNQPPASETPAVSSPRTHATRIIRRVHMFTGLFLGPWMVMYALSTLVMAHRDTVLSFYPSRTPAFATERELEYRRAFPEGASREEVARQILVDLGLEGRHAVSGGKNGQALVINRQEATQTRRITFHAAESKMIIQREEFRTPTFLERMHRRRGYDQAYAVEDAWGLSVELAVVTMVFWCLSGMWLWWELKPTRRWGSLALAAGPALFIIFLFFL